MFSVSKVLEFSLVNPTCVLIVMWLISRQQTTSSISGIVVKNSYHTENSKLSLFPGAS
jgi:hypothetical protein